MNSDKIFKNQKVKVAQYLRMSTDHQQYSIFNQSEFIKDYAEKHNMEIAYTYDDAGKSGINLSGRPALKQLLFDVMESKISIKAILFYDVSRFGRFQEIDEAGYYSHLFKIHGVELIFCAEPIPTKEFPLESSVILNIKRTSAAYHSKNLSEKVFIGQVNLVKRGFHQGGMAGYGLRRMLIDQNGNAKQILDFGTRKSLQTDRVILIPGPKKEIIIVNEIYNMFINDGVPEFIIAEYLNDKGIKAENGMKWTKGKIHEILTNEKYIGNNVYNRTSSKLKSKLITNPKEEWVRCDKAFKGIISRRKFQLAQDIILAKSLYLTNDQLLEHLKRKLSLNGRLSGFIIDEDELGPSSTVYKSRFGGLLRAYSLIGYTPDHDYSYIKINEKLKEKFKFIINEFLEEIEKINNSVDKETHHPLIYINNNISLSLVLSKCKVMASGKLRWKVRLEKDQQPDITIVIRMNSSNSDVVDYYILPKLDINFSNMIMKEKNSTVLDFYRYDCLKPFFQLFKLNYVRSV